MTSARVSVAPAWNQVALTSRDQGSSLGPPDPASGLRKGDEVVSTWSPGVVRQDLRKRPSSRRHLDPTDQRHRQRTDGERHLPGRRTGRIRGHPRRCRPGGPGSRSGPDRGRLCPAAREGRAERSRRRGGADAHPAVDLARGGRRARRPRDRDGHRGPRGEEGRAATARRALPRRRGLRDEHVAVLDLGSGRGLRAARPRDRQPLVQPGAGDAVDRDRPRGRDLRRDARRRARARGAVRQGDRRLPEGRAGVHHVEADRAR